MSSETKPKPKIEDHDEFLDRVADLKKKMDDEKKLRHANGDEDDDEEDETDALLSQAIEMAIADGRGWSPGEKEAYMARICDDEILPPLFASTPEEMEKSGLSEAFSSLLEDSTPTFLMLDFKQKGNDSFIFGKKNVAKNIQYYRDAVNHYLEAIRYSEMVKAVPPDYVPTAEEKEEQEKNDDPTYTEEELDKLKSTLFSNTAMAHMQLKNWGHTRDNCEKALEYNTDNVKACYRLAKAHQMLNNYIEAGEAIERGLNIPGEKENKDLLKLKKLLSDKIRKARLAKQKRERARAERVSRVKEVWKWCKESGIRLGRVPLVSTVSEDEELEEGEDSGNQEARWHQHHPHTGRLPRPLLGSSKTNEWTWPCMFLYPSHNQSDFIESFVENEMLAIHMAQIFPELEDDETETAMPWDYSNIFTCSNLAVYFEVHCTEDDGEGDIFHPDYVQPLKDQKSAMRFYEASRALKGDEGEDMAHLARCVERRQLYRQRKAWKKLHGSLWARPKPCPVVRVHPAATLRDVLVDSRLVVPNFLVTFILFPIEHPAHEEFLKEHKCVGLLEASNTNE